MDGLVRSGGEVVNYCPICGGEVGLASANGSDPPCPHCGHSLWFVRKNVGPAVVLTFLSALVSGHETPRQVREVLEAAGDCTRLVLDLSHLQFVPVSFLKMLVLLRHRLNLARVGMKLCGLHAHNSTALHRTRLDTLFEICADPQSALGS